MTVDFLAMAFGVITSLLFEYFPVVESWFGSQPANVKKLLQLAVAAIVAWGAFGLSCAGVLTAFTCDGVGAVTVLRLLFDFLIANQTAHKLTKRGV